MAFENVLIRSTLNGISPVDGFRQDLAIADLVGLSLTDTTGITTFRWEIVGRPEGSSAGGGGPEPILLGTTATASFTVDNDTGLLRDGTYIVHCIVNQGSPTETRIRVGLARLSGRTTTDGRVLRRMGAFEDETIDTADATIALGYAKQLLRWMDKIIELDISGGGSVGTLATVYAGGAVSADQTLNLSDADGGGVIFNGSGAGFNGTNTIRVLGAGGSQLNVLRANGYVGINQSNPVKPLHVTDSVEATLRLDKGTVWDIVNDGTGTLQLDVGGVVPMQFDINGARTDIGIGINTAAPNGPGQAFGAGSTLAVGAASTGRIRYNESTQKFQVSENGAAYVDIIGSAGAPLDAQYLVLTANGSLTDERVITIATTNGLRATDGGAGGAYTIFNTLREGLAGGQSVIGGNAASEDLTLVSTANATRGSIFFGADQTSVYDETAGWMELILGIGLGTTPDSANPVVAINGSAAATVSDAGTGWIRFNSGTNTLQVSENTGAWTDILGGGGGAPTTASYLVLGLDATLTNERVFVNGSGLSASDGGANGNYTLTNTLVTGLAGGQTVIGGTAATEDLTLQSTTNATRGDIRIDAARLEFFNSTNAVVFNTTTNGPITIQANRDAADTNADVIIRSTVTRTAGNLLNVNNNISSRFSVNFNGQGIFSNGTQTITITPTAATNSTIVTNSQDLIIGGVSQLLVNADGTAAAPGLASGAEEDTGLYWVGGASGLGISVQGTEIARFTSTTFQLRHTGTLATLAATNTNAGLDIKGNKNAGDAGTDVNIDTFATRTGGNLFRVQNNGVDAFLIKSAGAQTVVKEGTESAPGLNIGTAALDNGLYLSNTDEISITLNAGQRHVFKTTAYDLTDGTYTIRMDIGTATEPAIRSLGTNDPLALYGNRSAGDSGADILLRSNGAVTRTAGDLVAVLNGGVTLARIDFNGTGYFEDVHITSVGVDKALHYDSSRTTDPGDPATNASKVYIFDNGSTVEFRVKYNDGGTVKTGALTLS